MIDRDNKEKRKRDTETESMCEYNKERDEERREERKAWNVMILRQKEREINR